MSSTLSCYNAVKRVDSHCDGNGVLLRPAIAPLYMDVAFTGDRSGSMCSTQGGSQTGARDYIKKQVDAAATLNCLLGFYIDFTTFDDRIEQPFSGPASEVNQTVLNRLARAMEPRGSTRLYDAILDSLRRQMKRLETKFATLPEEVKNLVRDQPWLFGAACTPMTDGEDNSSQGGARQESRNACINFVQNYSATGMVLAANRDASQLARDLGLDPEAALQMGSTQQECVAAMNSAAAAQLRCATSGGVPPPPSLGRYFTQLERDVSYTVGPPTPPSQFEHTVSCPPRLDRTAALGPSSLNHLRVPAHQNTVLPPPPPQLGRLARR